MAMIIKEFPARQGKTFYPWDDWMDGNIWQAVAEVDFHITPEVFRQGLYQRASHCDTTVRTSVDGDVVTFQFV